MSDRLVGATPEICKGLVSLEEAQHIARGDIAVDWCVPGGDETIEWEPDAPPTAGPWHYGIDHCDCGDGYGCPHPPWVHQIRMGGREVDIESFMSIPDGQLAAAAPRLLATVIELYRQLEATEPTP